LPATPFIRQQPEAGPVRSRRLSERSNTQALGDVLYTDYIFFFQIAGMVLLVAMIGAIVLTLRHREHIKRQDINQQVARTPETAIEVVKVKPGQGI
jgi:NADH-quinone oxidoreductase subunit J